MSLEAYGRQSGGGMAGTYYGVGATVDTMQVTADLQHISHDRDLTMRIMKKRQDEMARRSKLLDPRKRQFGVDHAVLDAQVRAKREAQAAVSAEDAYYARNLAAQDEVLQTVEQLKMERQRQRQVDTINFSLYELPKERRREYPLSDPREYTSAFTTAPEEELGPSSMTKFEGQKGNAERKKAQQHESAQWLRQQMQEKKDRDEAEKDWDRHHDDRMLQANMLRAHCEAANLQEMKEDKLAEAQENLDLAEKRRQKDQARQHRDRDEQSQHARNVMTDPRLNEANDNTISWTGKKLDQKRLTLEEEQDVYNTNAHQIRSKLAAKRRAMQEEASEHHLILGGVAVRGAVEYEKDRMQKERNRSCLDENRRMAEAKRAYDVKERRAHRSFDYERLDGPERVLGPGLAGDELGRGGEYDLSSHGR